MAKQKVSTEETPSGISVLIDPKLILADDNTRFGLKQSRIDSLIQSISDQGGVIEPIEVEPLGANENGHKYRLTVGNYRLAAVTALNATGAGLSIPAIIHTNASSMDRLKRQLAENIERENMSPMDQAIAIKKLLDGGLSKMEVRTVFSRPGRTKNGKPQPASNSFINIMLSFLDFPKKIQNSIHDGTLGVMGAYKLHKLDPADWDAVLTAAKEERDAAIAREEAEDEKLLAAEKKAESEQAKIAILADTAQKAQTKLDTAKASYDEKAAASIEAQKVVATGHHKDAAAKKEAAAALKAAETNRKIAEADLQKAKDDAEKCIQAYESIQIRAAEKAKKLQEAKAAAPSGAAAKASKSVGPADVSKAAKAKGAATQYVMLSAMEMRNVVKFLCLPGTSKYALQVQAIGKAISRCFLGETTDKQLVKELEGIVAK